MAAASGFQVLLSFLASAAAALAAAMASIAQSHRGGSILGG